MVSETQKNVIFIIWDTFVFLSVMYFFYILDIIWWNRNNIYKIYYILYILTKKIYPKYNNGIENTKIEHKSRSFILYENNFVRFRL